MPFRTGAFVTRGNMLKHFANRQAGAERSANSNLQCFFHQRGGYEVKRLTKVSCLKCNFSILQSKIFWQAARLLLSYYNLFKIVFMYMTWAVSVQTSTAVISDYSTVNSLIVILSAWFRFLTFSLL